MDPRAVAGAAVNGLVAARAAGALAAVLVLALSPGPSQAQGGRDAYRPHVETAAARFGLPVDLLWAVIAAESAGDSRAVSRAGAMGLMQLMPGTWRAWRAQLSLGADPFDPHDNLMAGAAYLRHLRDRYGAEGFLAAYNAGPRRYEESLAGRPLPSETRRYVDRISGRGWAVPRLGNWQAAGLFPSGRLDAEGASASVSGPDATLFAPRRPWGAQ